MDDIPIVMYHSVNDFPSDNPLGHLSISTSEFEAQLQALRDFGFEFITMYGLLELVRSGDLPDRRLAVLTFDDGYLDNLLNAAPILAAFGASATVFVSPSFVAEGAVRTSLDVPNGWGYLNWQELQVLQQSGTFDVQSHTLTHDHVFVGNEVLDVYTREKFEQYYWLTHLLAPHTKAEWQGEVSGCAAVAPEGYPIFQHDRALSGPQFFPADGFVDECVTAFQAGGRNAVTHVAASWQSKGRWESSEECRERCERELFESKRIIESRLGTAVTTVCFPGGVYNQESLQHARKAGYLAYFRSSRDVPRNNRDGLRSLFVPSDSRDMVGLSRISFTRDYPRRYLRRSAAYWNARLKLDHVVHPTRKRSVFPLLRRVRNGLRQVGKW